MKTTSDKITKILDDAYELGWNDAILPVNDGDVLLPKMKAKLLALIAEAEREATLTVTDWATKFGDRIEKVKFDYVENDDYRKGYNSAMTQAADLLDQEIDYLLAALSQPASKEQA